MPAQSKLKLVAVRELAVSGTDAIGIFHALRHLSPVLLWESAVSASDPGNFISFSRPERYSFIGFARSIHEIRDGLVTMRSSYGEPGITVPCNDPFEYAQRLLEENFELGSIAAENSHGLMGGLAGTIGYDTARHIEHVAGAQGHPLEPDALLFLLSTVIAFDAEARRVTVYLWDYADSNYAPWFEAIDSALQNARPFSPILLKRALEPPLLAKRREEFVSLVNRAKDYIRAGDIFQVVLSNEFCFTAAFDPLSIYASLKQTNPSPFHHLISLPNGAYVGASPEVMLRGSSLNGEQRVFMRPVAGTYPRDSNPTLDRERAQELASNEKELAEHIMLVDLERNDIGRVSTSGSVKVSDLCSVESYSHVHHLVSQISGTLREDQHLFSALRACFPIGTLAGTPKIRAMEIIAELEQRPRGIFGGCCFLADVRGLLDSCVAIRGITIGEERAVMHAGAGVVFDSEAEREFEECTWKCHAMTTALGRLIP